LPPSQTITAANSASANGAPTLNWKASILFVTSAGWLVISPAKGTDNGVITVSVPKTNYPAGQYNAVIQIRDPNASDSPQEVPVTLTLASAPSLSISPASLTFTCGTGSNPAAQTIAVTGSGNPTNPVKSGEVRYMVSGSMTAVIRPSRSLPSPTLPTL